MILVDYLIAKYPYIASDLPIIYKNNVLLYDCEANYELEFIERREKINNNLYDIVKTYNNNYIYIYSNNSYIVNSSKNLNSILIYNNKYIQDNCIDWWNTFFIIFIMDNTIYNTVINIIKKYKNIKKNINKILQYLKEHTPIDNTQTIQSYPHLNNFTSFKYPELYTNRITDKIIIKICEKRKVYSGYPYFNKPIKV